MGMGIRFTNTADLVSQDGAEPGVPYEVTVPDRVGGSAAGPTNDGAGGHRAVHIAKSSGELQSQWHGQRTLSA